MTKMHFSLQEYLRWNNPNHTLVLLDMLEHLGLTDTAFSHLHHFRGNETIARHRGYCERLVSTGSVFRRNSKNILVQRRLELVLTLVMAGAFTNLTNELFVKLADISIIEYPIKE